MTDEETLRARAETFGSVFILVQYLSRLTDEALEGWGLTTRQWLLLAVLQKTYAGRSPSLTEAAEVYGSSRQNVKQIALALEARGYVRLTPDIADGRTTRIELTGREAIFDDPEGRARTGELLERAFGGLGAEETVVLRDLVTRWVAGLADKWRVDGRAEGTEAAK
jgi:DNA-binding MarR family transcriptional regulator